MILGLYSVVGKDTYGDCTSHTTIMALFLVVYYCGGLIGCVVEQCVDFGQEEEVRFGSCSVSLCRY